MAESLSIFQRDIQKFFEVSNMKIRIIQGYNAKSGDPDYPSDYLDILRSDSHIDELLRLSIPVYERYYSHEEVKALIAFHGSPVAQKALLVIPLINQENTIIGDHLGRKIAKRLGYKYSGSARQPQKVFPPAEPLSAFQRDIQKLLEVSNTKIRIIQEYNAKSGDPDYPPDYLDIICSDSHIDEYLRLLIPVYERYFSHEEVKALIAFHGSPVAQKAHIVDPMILQETTIIGEQLSRGILKKLGYKYKGDAKKGGCFITTAVCKTLQKPDGCAELTQFRNFRDTYMQATEEMCGEVLEYYEIAPKICAEIEKTGKEAASEKYRAIWEASLKPAFEALDRGDKRKAHDIYKNMVIGLKKELLGR